MKTISQEELDERIRLHELWLKVDKGGKRLYLDGYDLKKADFRYANLNNAYLRNADLKNVDLRGADLYGAILRGADLKNADLRSTDLRGADLRGADLYGAILRGADLKNADLSYANLSCANLKNVDLERADLHEVDLERADLQGAYLYGADLYGANLRSINNVQYVLCQRIISVQVDTSRRNNLINYWVDLDIVTTGCFQGTLQELKDEVEVTHANNKFLLERYRRVIKFIEDEVEFDRNRERDNEND